MREGGKEGGREGGREGDGGGREQAACVVTSGLDGAWEVTVGLRVLARRPVESLKKFLTGRHGQRDGRDGSTGCGTCEVPTVSFSGLNCGGGCRYSQYLSAHRDRYDANDARERMPHQNFRELTNATPTSEFGDCRNRSKLTGTWNFWGKIREDRDRGR
ncbi:hypothetical protein C8J57DRAFT_1222233 [Mycena rebaudengoi]|nr:hypothetical protein C8J57DRAFT_1222233 [Mycena rebaudengoi]